MPYVGGRRHDDRVDGAFIPGLRLAGEFYADAVRPLLDQEFPGLGHAAALLGPGSEVLGFDTERSTDHDWGPRLQLFLGADDAERLAGPITEMLAGRLPAAFRGYPVAFEATGEPGEGARHRVEVTGLGRWLTGRLGFDPRRGVTAPDWLARTWPAGVAKNGVAPPGLQNSICAQLRLLPGSHGVVEVWSEAR